MEYQSQSEILSASMVKTGDKLIIVEPAYSTRNEEKQTTYWNARVQLPDGARKIAGLFESVCDKFAKKWGNETNLWVGKTITVAVKLSKAGREYIEMTPSDDKDVVVPKSMAPVDDAGLDTIQYPDEEINPADIPF